MAVKQLSDGNDEGIVIGQSTTDKVGFYGTATPVAKQTITSIATTTATTTLLETRIARLETALAALDLVAFS